MTTATGDAAAAHRARVADPAALTWDTIVEAAVATAADLTTRSGHRPDHHTYLAGFFGTMAQAGAAGPRIAGDRQPADGRAVAADLGTRLADGVDDPTATLSGVDGIRDAVDAARRLASDGREPEAWSLLAGYTAHLGDRVSNLHLHAGPTAAERAALVSDEFSYRPHDPANPTETLGDALSL